MCDSVITFYPEWNGKLSDLNEWSTKQGGTAFQKSNDNTLTAKLDKNLTVNFFTASRSITITRGHATRDHMIQKTDDMKTWLRDTNDPNQSLDDDLKDILSRPATWKNPSKTISRSPSTTQIEEVDADETKTDSKKQLDTTSTSQKNITEEYNSIVAVLYGTTLCSTELRCAWLDSND